MKPFLDSVRRERREHSRQPGVSDHIVDIPHPSSANGDQNVNKSELGSPIEKSGSTEALDSASGEPGIHSDGPGGVEGEAGTWNYVGDGPQLSEKDEQQLRN